MYRKIEIIDTRLTGHGPEVVKCLGGRTARSMPAMTALEATTIPRRMLVVLWYDGEGNDLPYWEKMKAKLAKATPALAPE